MALPALVLPILIACALLVTSSDAVEFDESLFARGSIPDSADVASTISNSYHFRHQFSNPEEISAPIETKVYGHRQPFALPLTHKFRSGSPRSARSGLLAVQWEAHMAAVHRDLRRVRRGNRRLQSDGDSGGGDEEVVFGLVGNADPQIAGLYFASVELGSPPQLFNVQVDTGSDLLWVACRPCLNCAARSQVAPLSPPFNASLSVTNRLLPCATSACPRYHLADNVLRGCPSPAVAAAAGVPASACLYMLRYADGSASVGALMRDVLHLPWTASAPLDGGEGGGGGGSAGGGGGPAGPLQAGGLASGGGDGANPSGNGDGAVGGVARRSGSIGAGESGNGGGLNIVQPRRIDQEASAAGGSGSANNEDAARASGVDVTANGTRSKPIITFGCGFNQSGNLLDGPLTVDGVMGLGRGASSFLAQLGAQHALPHAFAHCLGGPEGGGALFLGRVSSAGALRGAQGAWQQTDLWDKPDSTQYIIGLAGIAIAGVPIPWQPARSAASPAPPAAAAAAAAVDAVVAAAANPAAGGAAAVPQANSSLADAAGATGSAAAGPGPSGSAGLVPCVLDSGTSLTYLPDSLYQTLTAALVQAIDLPLLAFAQTEGHFCYNLGDGRLPWPRARYLFPDLTLTFGNGARMVLPPENYILLLATTAGFEVPCIAWQSAGPDSSLAVLGDLALRNLLIEFDVEASTVRWLPSQCSQILQSPSQRPDPIDTAAAAADAAATAAEAFPESSDWLASLIPGLGGGTGGAARGPLNPIPGVNVASANLPLQNSQQPIGPQGGVAGSVDPSLDPTTGATSGARGASGNVNGDSGSLNLLQGAAMDGGGKTPFVLPSSDATVLNAAVLLRLLLAVACAILLAL